MPVDILLYRGIFIQPLLDVRRLKFLPFTRCIPAEQLMRRAGKRLVLFYFRNK